MIGQLSIYAQHVRLVVSKIQNTWCVHLKTTIFRDYVDRHFKFLQENDNNSHKETEKAISLKQEQLKTLNNELSNSRKECESLRAKVEQLESELFEMAEKNQDTRSDEIEELCSKLTGK